LKLQSGAGLVEALIAMLVTTIVLLGLSGLVIYGVRLQQLARNSTTLENVASSEVERLLVLPATAPERQKGGNLTANVANHFSTPQPGYTVRWTVTDGPLGTLDLTVRTIPNGFNMRAADVVVRLY
jgi:Tfp pilus assembly protein PilV